MLVVNYAVEGASDQPIAEALVAFIGASVGVRLVARGKNALDVKTEALGRSAAPARPWLVLRDADRDVRSCPGELIERIVGRPPPAGLVVRLAARTMESWLLADAKGLAGYLQLSEAVMPRSPDELDSPKRVLVDLASRSPNRLIATGLGPRPGSGLSVGPRYTELIREFVETRWSLARARKASPSLDRSADVLIARANEWDRTINVP